MILMLGDSAEDYMARTAAKWMNQQGIHVMAMSPDKKDYGHHSYPLERFGNTWRFAVNPEHHKNGFSMPRVNCPVVAVLQAGYGSIST